MRRFIGIIGDKVQAAFPPNRVAILLAGPITAASVWVAGFLSTNIPGLNLPVGVIAGIMGAAALITVRLIDRWFDQWQKGEPIDVDGDLDLALDELTDSPELHDLYAALGTMQVVEETLADLKGRIHAGTVNEAQVANSIESIGAVVNGFLAQHLEEPETAAPPAAIATPEQPPAKTAGPVAPADPVPPAGS